MLFAPAAAEGLSGGWGGDTGGAGGRAGARTGAARGNGRGAEGPRRALFTSRRQSSLGGRAAGEARPGRAAVSVAVGPDPRRPGGHDRLYPAVLLFSLSAGPLPPPPPPPPSPPGSGAAIAICVCNKTTTKTRGSSERPGPVPASLSPAHGAGPAGPRRECRGRSARLGTDSAPAALGARRPDPLRASVGHFHSVSKGQKNNPRCRESAPVQFPMPLMGQLAGLSSEEPRPQQNSLYLSS